MTGEPLPETGPEESPASLRRFATALSSTGATRSRLEKRRLLSEYLAVLSDEDLPRAVTFLTGRPFPRCDARKLSLGGSALGMALLSGAPDLLPDELHAAWLRHSDAGDAAGDVWARVQPVGPPVELCDMEDAFAALEQKSGPTEKVPFLVDLFRRMSADELRAFVKVMLSETRIGVQEGTVEDAVAAMSALPLDEVRAANRHRANLGQVALDARAGSLSEHAFAYFTPVDPMLAHPSEDTAEVIRRLGTPVWVENKYDGVRCQLHKHGPEVRLFSRDRKEITRQFPDVVAAWSGLEQSFAIDGEIMVLEAGQSMPFARQQQRLNRIAPTVGVLTEHPAALVAFDMLALGEESLLDETLETRRVRLETLPIPESQALAPRFTAESSETLDVLFEEAQARGNEGLMCKDPASRYSSGRRGYQWLKVKRPLETLDAVIVGAEWGHGKRKAVLSDYTFAVRDEAGEKLVNIGKAYGGLTDVEIAALTEELKALTLQDFGRYRSVEPKIVLEVEFNGIQESARHKSGFALRFPRIVRIRTDKGPADINTLEDVRAMYARLIHRGAPE